MSGRHSFYVWELIDFAAHRVRTYSYEVYRAGEKVCWYDPWEHPEIAALASTFPHHKHVLPNLRDNRVPAPGISFTGSVAAPTYLKEPPQCCVLGSIPSSLETFEGHVILDQARFFLD